MGASNAAPQSNEMGITKTKQVSFKVDDNLYERIALAAEEEELSQADFVRKLFVWGFEQYHAVGSWRSLRIMALSEEFIEKTLRDEREAYLQRRAQKQKKIRS